MTSFAPLSEHDRLQRSTTYKRGCRCEACVEWFRAYELKRKPPRIQAFLEGRAKVTHGTPSTYINYGCRCAECTEAAVERNRRFPRRRRRAS